MIDDRPLSADRVPTLTEVVELDLPADTGAAARQAGRAAEAAVPPEIGAAETTPALPPEVGPPDAAPVPLSDDAAGPAPPAMPDDFVLAGLEADAAAFATVETADAAEAVSDAASDAAGADRPVAARAAAAASLPDLPSAEAAVVEAAGSGAASPPAGPSAPPPAPPPAVDVDAVVGQVLAELLPRIDMLLESRLREALAPALARAADGLIRDTRTNLSVAVRDLVHEAVDRAVQRRAEE